MNDFYSQENKTLLYEILNNLSKTKFHNELNSFLNDNDIDNFIASIGVQYPDNSLTEKNKKLINEVHKFINQKLTYSLNNNTSKFSNYASPISSIYSSSTNNSFLNQQETQLNNKYIEVENKYNEALKNREINTIKKPNEISFEKEDNTIYEDTSQKYDIAIEERENELKQIHEIQKNENIKNFSNPNENSYSGIKILDDLSVDNKKHVTFNDSNDTNNNDSNVTNDTNDTNNVKNKNIITYINQKETTLNHYTNTCNEIYENSIIFNNTLNIGKKVYINNLTLYNKKYTITNNYGFTKTKELKDTPYLVIDIYINNKFINKFHFFQSKIIQNTIYYQCHNTIYYNDLITKLELKIFDNYNFPLEQEHTLKMLTLINGPSFKNVDKKLKILTEPDLFFIYFNENDNSIHMEDTLEINNIEYPILSLCKIKIESLDVMKIEDTNQNNNYNCAIIKLDKEIQMNNKIKIINRNPILSLTIFS